MEVEEDVPEVARRLRALRRPPKKLSVDGPWDHPGPWVAVVGTRRATDDGRDVAYDLARARVGHGAAILSGLARGIDAAAHRGALDQGGRTGAVLGTPLDTIYPPEHASLQSRVRGSLGLMTELEKGDPVTRGTFATRNRILAALADVVVVVQAPLGSGALLTARAALELGRPVAAIPWDSREAEARGSHELIRAGHARLACDAADVMELIRPDTSRSVEPSESKRPDPISLPPHERALFEALRLRPRSLDDLAERSGLSASQLGAALLALELHGLARREPGGLARRTRR